MMIPFLEEEEEDKHYHDNRSLGEEEKQCLICMDPSRNLIEEVNIIYNMPFLIKNCDCLCNIHYSCLEKWIKSNSICPICRKAIINEKLLAENITTIDNEMINHEAQYTNDRAQYTNDVAPNHQIVYVVPNKAITCIKTLFLIVFMFITIIFMNYFLR